MILIQRLTYLAAVMENTANLMRKHGGETADHGDELEGAAATVRTWIKGLEGEA